MSRTGAGARAIGRKLGLVRMRRLDRRISGVRGGLEENARLDVPLADRVQALEQVVAGLAETTLRRRKTTSGAGGGTPTGE